MASFSTNLERPPMTTRSRNPARASARRILRAVSTSAGKEDAHPDQTGTAVGTDNRPQLAAIDGQLRVMRPQLGIHLGCVSRGVAVDHSEPFQRPKSIDELDQSAQRGVHRAHALHGRDFAVAHADDWLDVQEPAEKRARSADTAAPLQELERFEQGVDPQPLARALEPLHDFGGLLALL